MKVVIPVGRNGATERRINNYFEYHELLCDHFNRFKREKENKHMAE